MNIIWLVSNLKINREHSSQCKCNLHSTFRKLEEDWADLKELWALCCPCWGRVPSNLFENDFKSLGLSDVRLFPFLPCHYSSEVFEAVFFAPSSKPAQHLVDVETDVFSQSWLGIYSRLQKTRVHCICGFKKKNCVTVSLLVHRRYTLHQQSVWPVH